MLLVVLAIDSRGYDQSSIYIYIVFCNILNIIYNVQNINNVRTSVLLQIDVQLGKLNKALHRTKTQQQQRRPRVS